MASKAMRKDIGTYLEEQKKKLRAAGEFIDSTNKKLDGQGRTLPVRINRTGQPGTGSYRKRLKDYSGSVGAGAQSRARNRADRKSK